MRFGCLRQHALRILFVAFLAQRSAHAQRQWPSCLPSEAAASSADQSKQGLAFLEIPAGATGCSLALLQGNAAPTSAVKLSSNAVIAGNSPEVLLLFTELTLVLNRKAGRGHDHCALPKLPFLLLTPPLAFR